MALTDSELTLGVLFKGRVDKQFEQATNNLKKILGGLQGSFDGVKTSA